jgi:autotransporter-associated beta strand protein
LSLAAKLTFDGSGTGTVTIAGAVSGSGTLVVNGSSTLTLTNANTYTGGTTLNTGTLKLSSNQALGTNTLTLAGGTLDTSALGTGANLYLPFNVTGTATWLLKNTLNMVSNSLTGGGTLNVTNGPLQFQTFTSSGGLANVDGFTGTINVLGGSLAFNGGVVNATNMTINLTNGVLSCGNANIGALSGDASSTVRGNGATSNWKFGALNTSTTFAGTLSTNFAGNVTGLIKLGTGILTLTGTNIYAGTTVISNGYIAVGGNQALSANLVTMAGGGLAGASGGGTLANVINLANTATFDTSSGNLTLLGAITNSGGLTKINNGLLTLAGSNTYSGTTRINGGTLAVNGSLNPAGTVLVNPGGTLAGTGTVGAVTVSGGGTISPGNSIGSFTASNVTLAGTLAVEINLDTGKADMLNVINALTLDINTSTVAFNFVGSTPISNAYVFAQYGAYTGTGFANVLNLPGGYSLDYTYGPGNQMAVLIPEPSSLALVAGSLLLFLAMPRRLARKKTG